MPYDIERDFAAISQTVVVSNLLVSYPSLPAQNVKALIAYIKSRPGQMPYAFGGGWQHAAFDDGVF